MMLSWFMCDGRSGRLDVTWVASTPCNHASGAPCVGAQPASFLHGRPPAPPSWRLFVVFRLPHEKRVEFARVMVSLSSRPREIS